MKKRGFNVIRKKTLMYTRQAELKRQTLREAYERSKEAEPKGGVLVSNAGDVHKVPGQNFTVLSYLTPDGTTKVRSIRSFLFKFSGSFNTEAEAREHAKIIRNENPMFNVDVVDMYKWGAIPPPDDERPFIDTEYVNPMLTRITSRIATEMSQGKREMDERKLRDRKKAEEMMRKVRGPDYQMPEKSAELKAKEDMLRKQRDEEEQKAREELRDSEVKYTISQISDLIMEWCLENKQDLVSVGSSITRFVAEKSLERHAQLERALESMKRNVIEKKIES